MPRGVDIRKENRRTEKSAARAANARAPGRRSRQAANSIAAAMTSSAVVNGTMSSRASRSATAIAIEDRTAIVAMILWYVLDPSASAMRAKAASTAELVPDDMTFKRSVASQISGAMMSTEVELLNAAANFASLGRRAIG